jgi:oleandomycin transport system permease protein
MSTLAVTRPAGAGVPALGRHALALAKRSLIKTMRTPEALIDVTIQPVIFLLLFTYLFGGAIAGDRGDYLQLLLPGMLAQSLAMGGVALGQNLNADIEKGVFDRFRSMPISRAAPLVGAVLADVVRYLSVCVVMLGFGTLVMGFRVETGFGPAVAAVALSIAFGLCFCWISVWVGMLARTSGAVQGIMFLLVLPLTFGSNVYVPTDTLPGFVQAFVAVNPITPLVATIRGLLVGGPVAGPLATTLIWMAGLLAVFVPLALRAYARRS